MSLHNVEVVVTYSKFPLGLPARWFGLYWGHAALRFRDACGRPRILQAETFGIKERSWWDFIRGKDAYMILKAVPALTVEQDRALMSFARGSEGKFYNYPWLLLICWRVLLKWLGTLIYKGRLVTFKYAAHVCTSFVQSCFLHCGINLVPDADDILVLPDDFANSPRLRMVELWEKS